MLNRGSITDDIKRKYQAGDMITRLIMVNVGAFLVFLLLYIAILIFADKSGFLAVYKFFVAPYNLTELLWKPWTLFTYMFMHSFDNGPGFWHLLFNMLWLFIFGRTFVELIGNSKVLPVYLMGGLLGVIISIAIFNLVPSLSGNLPPGIVGASASVYAIVFATVFMQPNYHFQLFLIGRIKIKYIAIVMVVSNLLMIASKNNIGGAIAHLGGALFGVLYVVNLNRGIDLAIPVNNFFDKVKGWFEPKTTPRVAYVNPQRATTKVKAEKPAVSSDIQKQLDEILDKISRSGYESLTKDEKSFLFNYSKD